MLKHAERGPGRLLHRLERPTMPDLRLFKKESYYICAFLKRKGTGTAMYFAVKLSDAEAKRIADLDRQLSNGSGDARLRAERARMLDRKCYFSICRDREYKLNQMVEAYPTEWQPYS